jgi:glutathione S-transferase
MRYTLISHPLCPYVQRAAITLYEKGLPFERRDIDLANKPDWFLRLSPLGKTPVLVVHARGDEKAGVKAGDEALFESAILCDYLDEVHPPRLHPEDALTRARHRAWAEYASAVLGTIGSFYTAPDAQALGKREAELRAMFATLEQELARRAGPWFAGDKFCLVDAAFAPVFRYFDTFEQIRPIDFFRQVPRVNAWRMALAQRTSVRAAVAADYPERLRRFIAARGSELSRLLETAPA